MLGCATVDSTAQRTFGTPSALAASRTSAGVTLIVTLVRQPCVSLNGQSGRGRAAPQGNKVEEVEDPPISSNQGDTSQRVGRSIWSTRPRPQVGEPSRARTRRTVNFVTFRGPRAGCAVRRSRYPLVRGGRQ